MIRIISDSIVAPCPLPAEEAFSSGTLLMPTESLSVELPVTEAWATDPINMGLLLLSLLTMLYLRRLVDVLPWLLRGMFSFRKLQGMQRNMRLIRERNSLTFVMCFCLCLETSGFGIYHPSYFDDLSLGMCTISIMVTMLLAALFRLLLLGFLKPSIRIGKETLVMANHCTNDCVIILSALLAPLCATLVLMGVDSLIIRSIACHVMLIVFFLFLVRKGQFLSKGCKQLSTILYLCSLEILPAGVVVLSAIAL